MPVQYAIGDLTLVIVYKILIVYKASIVVSADCTLLSKNIQQFLQNHPERASLILHTTYTRDINIMGQSVKLANKKPFVGHVTLLLFYQ